MYDNLARQDFEQMVQTIIGDNPIYFKIRFEAFQDPYGPSEDETLVGPFLGTLASVRHSRVITNFDEKGSSAEIGYILLSYNIPKTEDKETPKLGKEIITGTLTTPSNLGTFVADGREFRITAIDKLGLVYTINLDLQVE